jgi:diguanylate cyclase
MNKSLIQNNKNNKIETDSSASADKVTAEIVALLYADSRKAFFATIFVAAIIYWLLQDTHTHLFTYVWMALLLTSYAIRLICYYYYKQDQNKPLHNTIWLNSIRVASLLCGLAWGSACYFIFPEGNPHLQAMLLLCLAGVITGGLVVYALDMPAALLFSGSIWASLFWVLLTEGSKNSKITLLLSSLFVVYTMLVCKKLAGNYVNNITLRVDAEQQSNKIHQLAHYDLLTSLPNRRLLLDRLKQVISDSKRSKSHAMVVYLDLDNFKAINNAKGQSAGDHYLITISERLQKLVGSHNTVARMGEDEFALVLSDIGKANKDAYAFSLEMTKRIIRVVRTPVNHENTQHYCSASVGICLFMGDKVSANELVRRAEVSLHLAKKQGQLAYAYYDETMQSKYEHQQELKNDLVNALAENQFQLYLQGQFNKDAKPVGAEILLRWQHPKYGLIAPDDFIPLIEESGQIVPIGNWVIQRACQLLKKWEASPATQKLTLSVNVSAVQFGHPEFISHVESALLNSGCNPTLLRLELTESAVVTSVEDVIYKMNYLKSMGIALAIDDFGIGYSSLSLLSRLPLDELKIDKSFLHEITKGSVEIAIVETILQMGKSLKMDIVAEGVETEHQLEYLKSRGCKIFQGYLFAKPCSIIEFEKSLGYSKSSAKLVVVK